MNGSFFFTNTTNHTIHRLVASFAQCTNSWASTTAQAIIMTVLTVALLIENLLVVVIVYRNKSLRTTVNYFIVNMAISDLLIPVFYLPWKISQFYLDGIWLVDGLLGCVLCRFTKNTWHVSVFVSMFSMLAIAMDRFHAVVFPMKLPLFSRKKCLIVITLTWVSSFAFFGHFLYSTKIVSSDTGLHCVLKWDPEKYTSKVKDMTWMVSLFFNFLSALVLTVLYSNILLTLYRQKRNLRLAPAIIRKRAARNRKISLMLVFIVIIFYVTWAPFYVFYLYVISNDKIVLHCVFHILLLLIPTFSSVLNPIIYFTFNERYRQGLMELFCCSVSSRPVSPQGEDNVQNAGQMNNAIELHEQ